MKASANRFMVRDRYIKNGKLKLNLLRPQIEFFVRRWGYFDKETTCKFFEFVVSLLKEDMKQAKPKGRSRQNVDDSLPSGSEPAPANAEETEEGLEQNPTEQEDASEPESEIEEADGNQ